MDVFSASKYCPTLSETVDLRVLNLSFRDFSLLNVDFICATTANAIDTYTDIFKGRSFSVNDWLVSDIFTTKFRNCVISVSVVNLTCVFIYITRVGTLIVATIYLQLIQNRYMFRSFTVLQYSHHHCVQPVASDVEVVGYL